MQLILCDVCCNTAGLPQENVKRKCQQLENLTTAVMMMAKPGDMVVDFCSGSVIILLLNN